MSFGRNCGVLWRWLGRRSISFHRGCTAGAIVVTKYAVPISSSAGDRPNAATATPPSSPPNGISDQLIARFIDVTRPIRGAGMRSKSTAPRTGLRKPDAHPPITATTRIDHSGAPSASITNRGTPARMNATR